MMYELSIKYYDNLKYFVYRKFFREILSIV